METVKKEQKQLLFEFCFGCGDYLRADQVQPVIRDGKAVVLCPDCADLPDDITTAEEFEKKYNLS
jgi:hypothetical protein